MTAQILKITGPQFTVNATANTVFGASGGGSTCLRILNTSTGLVTITVANNGANVGSIQIVANSEIILRKYSGDTIVGSNNSTIFATPVGIES